MRENERERLQFVTVSLHVSGWAWFRLGWWRWQSLAALLSGTLRRVSFCYGKINQRQQGMMGSSWWVVAKRKDCNRRVTSKGSRFNQRKERFNIMRVSLNYVHINGERGMENLCFYFTNLPKDISHEELHKGFQLCGKLEYVFIANMLNEEGQIFQFC